MDFDPELQRWQKEWQAQEAIPAALVHRVERANRWMRWEVAGEIGVTLAVGGGSLGWAVVSRRADVAVLAAGIWMIIAIAWTASIVLRRGAWQPSAATTAAFVDISVLRCERGLQTITVQAVLFVVILTFDLVWLYAYRGETSVWVFLTRPMVIALAWVGSAVSAAAALLYRRRLRRELASLRRLREEIGVR